MADIYIATEDRLSEAIAEKMILTAGHKVADKIPKDRRRHAGFGYLKVRLPDFIRACHSGLYFLVLTDLDAAPCPPELLDDWLGGGEKPQSLLLRIAVREVEAWVLADREHFSGWLGISENDLPEAPEANHDPKATLLAVAKKTKRRNIKEGLLPKKGATSKIGLEYNDLLCAFVSREWNIENAAKLAPSLERALQRLREIV